MDNFKDNIRFEFDENGIIKGRIKEVDKIE